MHDLAVCHLACQAPDQAIAMLKKLLERRKAGSNGSNGK